MTIPKIERRFECAASPDNPDVTVIYLYGYVTDEKWWGDDEAIVTADVRRALLAVSTPEIHLHVNSLGGSVFDGVAIHNLIKQHKAKVTAFVDGIAASAASVIIMGADRIVMPANTMLMVHRAQAIFWGNAAGMRKCAADLDAIDAAVVASYQGRFVGTPAELGALLDSETFLTAAEAAALGFCDEIMAEAAPEPEPEPPPQQEPPKNALLQKYGFRGATEAQEPKPQANLNLANCLEAFFNGIQGGAKCPK